MATSRGIGRRQLCWIKDRTVYLVDHENAVLATFPFRRAALVPLLLFSGCEPALVDLLVPSQVRPGSTFEVAVVADTTFSTNPGGDAGCVLQVPNAFTVVGYRVEVVADVSGNMPTTASVNTPQIVNSYTAEPGNYLVSFVGSSGSSAVSGRLALKVFLQASTGVIGPHTLKVAMVGGTPGNWTAYQPAGVTQFASITAAPFVRSFVVAQGVAGDFELDANGIQFGTSSSPTRLQRASLVDFNLDGISDLVAASSSFDPQALAAIPAQAWTSQNAGLSGWVSSCLGEPMACGDFDGDGFKDIAYAEGRTFFGNGGTSWTAGPTLPGVVAAGVAVGDTNGDGCADVLLCSTAGEMALHRGNANRSFTQANNGLPTQGNGYAEGVVLADLTGDGNLDVYALRTVTPNVWIGDGLGNWTAGTGLPATMRRVVAADITGDGTSEMVFVGQASDPWSVGMLVYQYQGGSAWAPLAGTGLPGTERRTSAAVLDFDLDGDLDLAVGLRHALSWTNGMPMQFAGVELWSNTGAGQFQLQTGTGLSAIGSVSRLSAGDFSGDSVADLAIEVDGKTLLYRNTRGTATCTFRNGSGINPVACTCLTPPTVGTTWHLEVAPGPQTLATFLFAGVNAIAPAPLFGGELLIDQGAFHVSTSIPVAAGWQGLTFSLQGLRLDSNGVDLFLVLTNAQDAVIGS